MYAVSRINYLHSRYRRANKILNEDMLHTLGDGLAEIFRVVDGQEWRCLSEIEKCALGVFHFNLGRDMDIPFDALPSAKGGWRDGRHFAQELVEWTMRYEEEVCRFTPQSRSYVEVYVDSATARLPKFVGVLVRKMLGFELHGPMRESLGYDTNLMLYETTFTDTSHSIEAPGLLLKAVITVIQCSGKYALRYLALPRSAGRPAVQLDETPDADSGLYHFSHSMLKPWYVKPTFWTSWGPRAMFVRLLGGYVPGEERFKPQGYSPKTIGPDPQEGKGLNDMEETVNCLRASGAMAQCPFSFMRFSRRDAIGRRG